MPIRYFTGQRGVPGFLIGITNSGGTTDQTVIPAVVTVDATGAPVSGGGKQETVALATANTPSASQTVYGGDYIFSQTASAYGTIALQVLGPDGATWQTLISKTAADTAGGTGLALGSNAVVQVVLTGTTAASVTLSRVP